MTSPLTVACLGTVLASMWALGLRGMPPSVEGLMEQAMPLCLSSNCMRRRCDWVSCVRVRRVALRLKQGSR